MGTGGGLIKSIDKLKTHENFLLLNGDTFFQVDMRLFSTFHFNKNAFVRSNPNYLYSGKKLYLPSINEIKNLIIKKNKKIDSNKKYNSPSSSQIYFFGG